MDLAASCGSSFLSLLGGWYDKKKFDEVRSLVKHASDVNNKEIKEEDLEIDETLFSDSETYSIVTATVDETYFKSFKYGVDDIWSGKKWPP